MSVTNVHASYMYFGRFWLWGRAVNWVLIAIHRNTPFQNERSKIGGRDTNALGSKMYSTTCTALNPLLLFVQFEQWIHSTRWVQKSTPTPTTLYDIFALAECFCMKLCTFIGNLHPHMSTNVRSFFFTCNKMAFISLRDSVICTVSSFDCSAISLLCKNADYQLNGNNVIVFVFKCLMFWKQMIVWFWHWLLYYVVFKVIIHTNGKFVLRR